MLYVESSTGLPEKEEDAGVDDNRRLTCCSCSSKCGAPLFSRWIRVFNFTDIYTFRNELKRHHRSESMDVLLSPGSRCCRFLCCEFLQGSPEDGTAALGIEQTPSDILLRRTEAEIQSRFFSCGNDCYCI